PREVLRQRRRRPGRVPSFVPPPRRPPFEAGAVRRALGAGVRETGSGTSSSTGSAAPGGGQAHRLLRHTPPGAEAPFLSVPAPVPHAYPVREWSGRTAHRNRAAPDDGRAYPPI